MERGSVTLGLPIRKFSLLKLLKGEQILTFGTVSSQPRSQFGSSCILCQLGRGSKSVLLTLLVAILVTGPLLGSEPGAAAATEPDAEVTEENTSSQSGETEDPAPIALPKFQNLRFQEDWSVLREATPRKGYQKLKFIPLNASENMYLSIGGQLRLRAESWWNFGFGDKSDVFGLSRVRMHADLHLGSRFRMFVEGKSSLSAGRDLPGGNRTLDVDNVDFQNAFIDVNLALEPATVILRPGRQELQFGGQRLVSPLDWANTRRTFDGVRGIVKKGEWRFDGFWSQAVAVRKYSLNCGSASGKELYGIYATGKFPASATALDLYWLGFLNERAQFGDISGRESRQTIGARSKGSIKETGADYELEAAYQFGDLDAASISAFMFTGQVGYTFASTRTKPRLYTNLDFATGDDDPSDNSIQTFNQLFPLGHAYLGYIDFVGRQNVIDWSGGLALSPAPKWKSSAAAHYFWRDNTNDAIYNPGGSIVRAGNAGSSRAVGLEIDLTLGYAVNQYVNLSGGYSHFFPGEFIKESGSSNAIDFLYFVFQVTF